MLGVIAFADEQVDELAAALGQIGQLRLLGRSRGDGLEERAVFEQHGGINGIGFGALALGAGEVTDAPGFDDADGNAGRLQGPHDRLFVTAGGFANDVRRGMTAQAFEELGVTFGVIGQEVETAREMQLQRELGNVEADIQEVWIVLTHTCGIRATMVFRLSCSSNGSSLGQWAQVERALRRITLMRMRGVNVLTRAFLRPVATGRRTPAWRSLSSLPSRTIRKIQGVINIKGSVLENGHSLSGFLRRCSAWLSCQTQEPTPL